MPIAVFRNVIEGSDPYQDFVVRLFDIGPVAGIYVASFLLALRLALRARAATGYWSVCALLQGLGPVVVAAAAILDSVNADLPACANAFSLGYAMIVCGPALTSAGLVRILLPERAVAGAEAAPLRQRPVLEPEPGNPRRGAPRQGLHEPAHLSTGRDPSITSRLKRWMPSSPDKKEPGRAPARARQTTR